MIRLPLTLLLFLAGNLVTQSASRAEFDGRLLRGDFAGARAILGSVTAGLSDPERSLCEAAVLRAPERTVAMLAVARAYRRHAVADRALAAAAAAILLGRELGDLAPRVESREPEAVDAWAQRGDLDRWTVSLHRALGSRRDRDVRDRAAFLDAKWMARVARVRSIRESPIRVRTGQPLPVPSPLVEPLTLRVYEWPLYRGAAEFSRRIETVAPLREHHLETAKFGARLPSLAPGEYVFELESDRTGWIVVRSVLVSDLDLIVQRVDRAVVALVEQAGHPVEGAQVRVGERRVRSNARGIAVLEADPKQSVTVVVTLGRHSARTELASVTPGRITAGRTYHAMVDRPVYRRGEKVRGRVVMRTSEVTEFEGLGGLLATGCDLAPIEAEAITIVAWPESGSPVRYFGRTDRFGVMPFTLPVPDACKLGWVVLRAYRGRLEGRLQGAPLASWKLFQVTAYRRAAVIVDLTGPAIAGPGGKSVQLELSARLASGAPAVGCRVDVEAVRAGSAAQRQSGVLDQGGRLLIPLANPMAVTTGDRPTSIVAKVTSPDGRVVTVCHTIEPIKPQRVAPLGQEQLRVEVVGEALAGEDLHLRIHGPADAVALLCVARDIPFATARLVFDARGVAEATVSLDRLAWPSVDVFVATRRDRTTRRVSTRPFAALGSLTLVTDRTEYAPGDEVVCTLRATRRGGGAVAGRPVSGRVTLAVVDDRIFAITPDRTPPLIAALAPRVPGVWWRWRVGRGIESSHPLQVLGNLLRRGELSLPAPGQPSSGGPSAAGRPAIGPAVTARADFRPTVYFSADLAIDPDGRVEVRFRLPDGLTTYRLTALAVDAGAGTAEAVHRIHTRKQLAVTPLLPRVLRQGDRVRLPIVVDHADSTSVEGAIHLQDESGVLAIAKPTARRRLGLGAAETYFELVAQRVGEARLRTTVRAGRHTDATLHQRSVLANTVTVPVTETIRFSGDRDWQPTARGETRELTILASRAAVLGVCATYLARYPHGCVEQTLSRILPFFATVRAGGRPTVLAKDERRRLRAGLQRLRELLVGDDRGFAWWPGGKPDDGMSALVVHGLVMAREGGLRLAEHGLQLRFDRGYVDRRARALIKSDGRVQEDAAEATEVTEATEALELVIAALRFQPTGSTRLLLAVQRVAARDQDLPAGLLGRMGLALLAAGDRAAARRSLQRVLTGDGVRAVEDVWTRFPGEEPAAVVATRLELALALRAKGTAAAALELYSHFGNGRFGSTYATGCAIAALLVESKGRLRVGGDQIVDVRCGTGFHQRVTLTAAQGYRAQLRVPTGRLVFASRDDRELIGMATTVVTTAADSNPGWRGGLVVERRLCRPGTNVPAAPRREEPIDVVVTVRGARAVRYVVVSTPLPAGFEVRDAKAGLDVFDERVVTTLMSLPAGRAREVRFTVTPALAGAVSWPPVVASAMYAAGCQGGTPGAVVRVGARVTPPTLAPLRPFFSSGPVEVEVVEASPAQLAWARRDRQFAAFAAWIDDRTATATVMHATAPATTPAERQRLEGLDLMFRDLSVEEEMERLSDLGKCGTAQQGAAPGPLLQEFERWLQAHRVNVCMRLHGRVLRELEAGSCPPLLHRYLDVLEKLGPAASDRFLAVAAAVLRYGNEAVVADFLRDHDEALRASVGLDVPVAPVVLDSLVALLDHASEEIRRLALQAIPGAMQWLPTAVIERALGNEWDTDDVRAFLRHPLGAERLLVMLANPEFREWVGEDCAEILPPELIRRAPLASFRTCFGVAALAASNHRVADLEAELLRASQGPWREKLLLALAARGRSGLAHQSAGPNAEEHGAEEHGAKRERAKLYGQLLAAWSGDRDAALLLRRRIWEWARESRASGLPVEPVFVARMFRKDWTVREFLRWADEFDETVRGRWLCEYPDAWRIRLVSSLQEQNWFPLVELPEQLSPALRAALWSLGQRQVAWRSEVVEVLGRRPIDLQWLGAKIAASTDVKQRGHWRELTESYDEAPDPDRFPHRLHRFGLGRR